jgi:hypothetical protein
MAPAQVAEWPCWGTAGDLNMIIGILPEGGYSASVTEAEKVRAAEWA